MVQVLLVNGSIDTVTVALNLEKTNNHRNLPWQIPVSSCWPLCSLQFQEQNPYSLFAGPET